MQEADEKGAEAAPSDLSHDALKRLLPRMTKLDMAVLRFLADLVEKRVAEEVSTLAATWWKQVETLLQDVAREVRRANDVAAASQALERGSTSSPPSPVPGPSPPAPACLLPVGGRRRRRGAGSETQGMSVSYFCEGHQDYVERDFCTRCAQVCLVIPEAASMNEALQQPLGCCANCRAAGLSGDECWAKHFAPSTRRRR